MAEKIRGLLEEQKLAVIATPADGHPYTNLVAFLYDPDLKWLAFPTLSGTSKYRNIESDPRISVLIDNRKNRPEDLHNAVTVTALGQAEIQPDSAAIRTALLARHPGLRGFLARADCRVVKVQVERYIFVDNFQRTTLFVPGK